MLPLYAALIVIGLLLVSCSGCITPRPTPVPPPVPKPAPPDPHPVPNPDVPPLPQPSFPTTSQELLRLHNAERQRVGSWPLTLDKRLETAAQKHATWMSMTGKLDHDSPSGTHSDRMVAEGYQPKRSGENIAMGYRSVSEVMQGWLSSPGHAGNIRNPSYVNCGFGIGRDSRGRFWWSASFAQPKSDKTFSEESFGASDTYEPTGITADHIS